jgi:uncharacterized protein (TIGR03067 family)
MNRLMLATICLLWPAWAASADDKKDLEPFQGKWKITEIIADGETIPMDEFKDAVLTVTGNERLLKVGEEVKSKSTYKVDPAKDPKTIDIMVSEGPLSGKTFLGVYEFKDGKVRIAAKEGERPKDLASAKGSGILLQTFERIRDK